MKNWKIIYLLHNDSRWENLRSYLLKVLGTRLTSFIFGLAITMVCPLMSMFQVFSFGLVMNILSFRSGKILIVLKHILVKMKHQLIIIIDSSVMKFKTDEDFSESNHKKVKNLSNLFYSSYLILVCEIRFFFIIWRDLTKYTNGFYNKNSILTWNFSIFFQGQTERWKLMILFFKLKNGSWTLFFSILSITAYLGSAQ